MGVVVAKLAAWVGLLTVRAGRGAAVGVVAEGVDVHATLGVGVVAGDVPGDSGGGVLGLLLKDNSALDVRVAADNTDWQRAMTLEGAISRRDGPQSRLSFARVPLGGFASGGQRTQTCS